MFAVNRFGDTVFYKPVGKAYKTVIPKFARRGIGNFFDNLKTPRSSMNNFLQGKPGRGFSELARFIFNSSLGVGGLFDVAAAGDMQRFDEDFSQTLSVWGVPDGPFLMIPIWGPRTVLSAAALPVDMGTFHDAYSRFSQGDLEQARAGFERFRHLDLDHIGAPVAELADAEERFHVARFNIGINYAHLGDRERSLRAFRELIDRHTGQLTDIIQLFAESPATRTVIAHQPGFAEALARTCPELFEMPHQGQSTETGAGEV